MIPLLLSVLCAQAPSDGSIAVTPLVVERTLRSGHKEVVRITVANPSLRPLLLKSRFAPFKLSETGDVVLQALESSGLSRIEWLVGNALTENFKLEAGEQRAFEFSFRADGRAASSYCAWTVATVGASTDQSVEIETGTLILLKREGSRSSAKVRDLSRAKSAKGTVFTIRIENDGQAHWTGKATLLLRSKDRKVVARLPLEGGSGTVLPGGVRKFLTEWHEHKAISEAEVVLEADGRTFRSNHSLENNDLSRPTGEPAGRDGRAARTARYFSPLAIEPWWASSSSVRLTADLTTYYRRLRPGLPDLRLPCLSVST